jgi:hypothetical protein
MFLLPAIWMKEAGARKTVQFHPRETKMETRGGCGGKGRLERTIEEVNRDARSGAGATLRPAMTFGYVCRNYLANSREAATRWVEPNHLVWPTPSPGAYCGNSAPSWPRFGPL